MGKADEGIAEDVCRGGLEANCTYGPRWGGGDRGMCGCKHVSVPQCTLFEVFVLPCALTLLLPTSHNLSANVLIIIKELFYSNVSWLSGEGFSVYLGGILCL